jgi:transcription elongation factor Elf1
MSLFDDLINYELCFPGAVTGSTEVECPRCDELLTVPVDDPMGQDTFQCSECSGNFDVDRAEGTVTPWSQLELSVDVNTDQ